MAAVAGLLALSCGKEQQLSHPVAPQSPPEGFVPSAPLTPAAGLGTGVCMGNDAILANAAVPGTVSGFGSDPLNFNCTANDVRIANARTASGLPIPCVPGDPINDVDILADVEETATSVRHDIGIWVENGDNGVGGAENGACDFFYFDDADVVAEPGAVDADGDNCGDMENAGVVNGFELGDLDLVCPSSPVVVDGRTFVEVESCVSWTQPGGDRVCPIPGESSPNSFRWGTLPANKSKCNCEPFLIEVTILAQLTLEKIVINDDGGTAVVNDFQAKIDGGNVPWFVAQELLAGSYTASETVVTGYTAGNWGGDCAADGSITLAPGDIKTCTI
jgi:hypothetical protein